MTYEIVWSDGAIDHLAALNERHPEAAALITAGVYDLAANPRPANASRLGGSDVYRLLLGYYRVLYEVQDKTVTVDVLSVGRSDRAR
ncbi:type II toxin-antitoxin system RelE family toxin [Streptomyces xinghaiensis]|uniref:type II toxin-antitoxin system RelE family toxin n=1 Tax=Streptomyces xinghaiensis TaxID=1038928 RepID=UPI0002FC27EC|nr:type II toxin-antitoxin system RelE/ParE family toxin [Streptomyces xinghaiensis]MZE79704.1 type II toxin-antitoxin system RelE/ParE family toxin [Streptomyces sp. SID5475]